MGVIVRHDIENEFFINAFYASLDRVVREDYNCESGFHNFWEIVYVDSGEMEVTEGENVYLMGGRNIIIHAPMEFHRLRSCGGTTPRVIHINFDAVGDFPEEVLSGVYMLDEGARKELIKITRQIQQWMEEGEDRFFGREIADKLASFLFCLCRTNESQKRKVSNERVSAFQRLVECMNEEVLRNVSIAEIAEKMFMSVSYVKALFKRYAGVSPKAYYTNLQIQEAVKMLDEGKSVREVSEQMNFSTSNYFSVFFKKHTGLTPKHYKNSKSSRNDSGQRI